MSETPAHQSGPSGFSAFVARLPTHLVQDCLDRIATSSDNTPYLNKLGCEMTP
jgi:hypothetical protein